MSRKRPGPTFPAPRQRAPRATASPRTPDEYAARANLLQQDRDVLRSACQVVVATSSPDCPRCRESVDACRYALEQVAGVPRGTSGAP